MITPGFYIIDSSVKRMNAQNVLQESLWYTGNGQWASLHGSASAFEKVEDAISEAKKLHAECPVKVLQLQVNGNNIGIGEIQF